MRDARDAAFGLGARHSFATVIVNTSGVSRPRLDKDLSQRVDLRAEGDPHDLSRPGFRVSVYL